MARYLGGFPADSDPVNAFNSTDISDTTAQTILAGSAGKAIFITQVTCVNKTAAELPVVLLQDDATPTPASYDHFAPGAGAGEVVHVYNPPLQIATGKGLKGVALTATGDCKLHVKGFIGTP